MSEYKQEKKDLFDIQALMLFCVIFCLTYHRKSRYSAFNDNILKWNFKFHKGDPDMSSYFRFSAESADDVRQLLGAASYVVDVRPHAGQYEIMIRDVALDRFYFVDVPASVAAEFDN